MNASIILNSSSNQDKNVNITKDAFTIGRANSCDLVITDNKFISKCHCTLRKQLNNITITCQSSNGILINGKKLSNSKTTELQADDVVHLVQKKENDKYNISFTLQVNTNTSTKEDNFDDSDSTIEYELDKSDVKNVDDDIAAQSKSLKRTANTSATDQATKSKLPCLDQQDTSSKATSSKATKEADDAMAENLVCCICQDVFHDCVSCQPCMHSFCGGCYSMWKENSSLCPTCRQEVQTVAMNHIINNLTTAYLDQHPEKKRNEADLSELDEKNTIKSKSVAIKRKIYDGSSYNDDSSYMDSDQEGSDYDSDDESAPNYFTTPVNFRCRECQPTVGPSTSIDGTSTSTGCSDGDIHLKCACCAEFLPYKGDKTNRQCIKCKLFYCHMYWGCRKPGCSGCLNHFKDLEFSDVSLYNLIRNNQHESEILKNYLLSKNITSKDLLRTCIEKLNDGAFTCNTQPNDIVCYRCGLRDFETLAYQYRRDIPIDDLPNAVKARENCYWGKACRTQYHNINHARRYNHICEQVRFS